MTHRRALSMTWPRPGGAGAGAGPAAKAGVATTARAATAAITATARTRFLMGMAVGLLRRGQHEVGVAPGAVGLGRGRPAHRAASGCQLALQATLGPAGYPPDQLGGQQLGGRIADREGLDQRR